MDTLETSRLLIRPFTLDDLEIAHHLYDLEVQWGGPGVLLEARRERLEFQISLAAWRDNGQIYGDRAITLQPTGEIIGMIGFRAWTCTPAERCGYNPTLIPLEGSFNSLEMGIGYFLGSAWRGCGYCSEAARALIDHAFTALNLVRVVALTERGNWASVRVMQRAGMMVGFNPDPSADYPWAIGIATNPG